jgi:capsular polysaccharide export protein
MGDASGRVFLFLQGPHGPFFRRLAAVLAAQGVAVRRIAFNAADEAEWGGTGPLDRYLGKGEKYETWLARYLDAHGITDVVLYGDSRPEHAMAVALAWQRGLVCHCLEEGYLRPHWVTYERWGNNGNSALISIPAERMAAAVGEAPEAPPPPDGWGAWGPHLWHSLAYHLRLAVPSRRFGRYRSRRGVSLWRELGQYLVRLAGLPARRALQRRRMRGLAASGRPYHLVLLQLSFDASMQCYSDYRSSAAFVRDCLAAFAEGAKPEDMLVFKSHPFEDGREQLGRVIAREARRLGVARRVRFLDGGDGLAEALEGARSVVTVNSTGAQQALCRGLPVAALGQAVYARPGLASDQPLAAFFTAPEGPDGRIYAQFRRFLLESSQVEGSFYSRRGIAALLERLPAAMLARGDPYEELLERTGQSRHAAAARPSPGAEPERRPEKPGAVAEPRRLAV